MKGYRVLETDNTYAARDMFWRLWRLYGGYMGSHTYNGDAS